ncbi:sugar efflux transporter [Cohnella yongneupensis]|uniref:Sugar efflux transporter n=1 Tax=Cohnella yongneupensis TaxID=425006 RepID=A0ABW0QT85_9BACL
MQSNQAGFMSKAMNLFRVQGFPALIFVNILLGISFSFVLPFTSLFGIDEVEMTNTSFGVFMTVSTIANVIVSTYVGKISDGNFSRRTVILICTVSAAIGYTGYAFVRDYYALLAISSIVLGVASSSFGQVFAYARVALSRSGLSEQDTPFYMNLFRMFFALSWTVGPAIGSFILIKHGFKGLFLSAVIMYVLVIAAVLLFMKNDEEERQSRQPKAVLAPPVPLGKLILRPHIFVNLVAFTFVAAATTIGSLNMSQFLTKVMHSGEGQIGIAFSIPPVFEIPFMLMFGIIATKIDNRILIRLGVLFGFLYFALLYLSTNEWEIYLIQILSAAMVSITQGIALTYFQNFIPDMPGTATTLYMNTGKVGSMIAFLIFGFTAELYGYRSVYLVCTVLVAISLVLLWVVGKREVREAAS